MDSDNSAGSTIKVENGLAEHEGPSFINSTPRQHVESFIIPDQDTDSYGINLSTRRQMNFVKNQFEAWFESAKVQIGKSIQELTRTELAAILKKYYLTARKKDGSSYKLCSFQIIRRYLALIFQHDYGWNTIDIISDSEFTEANGVFNEMVNSLRGVEESKSGVNESWRLTPIKLIKLYTEGQLDFYNTLNPKVLLQTVFFYICYYTGVGKLSVMKKITMRDIEEVLENDNVIAYNFHLRQYLSNEKGQGPFTINRIPGKPWCPVLTIQQYLIHRNTFGQCFFQKPFPRSQCLGSNTWYRKCRFKDCFPLTNMCREARVEPALTSGCFNKRRISAEIRFEMTPVYAKLFPGYFDSSGIEPNNAGLAAGQKRPLKRMLNQKKIKKTVVVTDLTEDTVRTVSQTVQVTEDAETRRMSQAISNKMHTTSPSLGIGKVVHRGLEDFSNPKPPTLRSEPSLSLSDRPSMVGHDLSGSYRSTVTISGPPMGTTQGPHSLGHHATSSVHATVPQVVVVAGSSCSIASTSHNHEKSPNLLTIHHHQQHTAQQQQQMSQQQQLFSAHHTPSSASHTSASSDTHHPLFSASQSTEVSSVRQKSSSLDTSPRESATKRRRFNGSNYTFLQDISASAREQGKGAVMLLLSLLDDLSNNNGKELLKDILQEMNIV